MTAWGDLMQRRDLYAAATCLREFLAGSDTPQAWVGGMLIAAACFAWLPKPR